MRKSYKNEGQITYNFEKSHKKNQKNSQTFIGVIYPSHKNSHYFPICSKSSKVRESYLYILAPDNSDAQQLYTAFFPSI